MTEKEPTTAPTTEENSSPASSPPSKEKKLPFSKTPSWLLDHPAPAIPARPPDERIKHPWSDSSSDQ